MSFFNKLINSWQLFGFIALISKAWEKFVVDRYRFRTNISREVPRFPERTTIQNNRGPVSSMSNPLHICYLIHFFYPDKNGGTERFVLNVAKEQIRLGNQVTIVTLGKRPLHHYDNFIDGIYYQEYEFEGLQVVQIRYKRAPQGLYYDSILEDEPRMETFAEVFLTNNKVDVVHVAYPQPFATFLSVCKNKGIPYIVTLTDFNILCHYSTLVSKKGQFCTGSNKGEKCVACKTYGVNNFVERYKKAEQILHNAECRTVPSEFVAKIIENEFDDIFVDVIPHGIDERFTNIQERNSTKKFVYAGTLSDLKGVHLLLKAFKMVTFQDITLEVYGAGEGFYIEQLKRIASGDSRIEFCGSVSASEICAVYQTADCVIIPSIWFETYNFVLREALACGCLVIASNMGAMPEAIIEGKNGYVFESSNIQSLVEKIEQTYQFNWDCYHQSSFPLIEEEALQYNRIYHEVDLRL